MNKTSIQLKRKTKNDTIYCDPLKIPRKTSAAA